MRWSISSSAPPINAATVVGLALSVVAAAIILNQPFPLNVAVIPGAAIGVAYLLYPLLGPLLLVASVPVQLVGASSFAGVGLSATKLALGGAVAAFVIQVVARRERLRGSTILAPYIAYLLAMVISLDAAQSLGSALAEIYRWVVTLVAFVLVLYAVRSRRAVLAMVLVFAVGAIAEAGLGTIQALRGLGPRSFQVAGNLSRGFGTFGTPNTFAGYLEMTGPVALTVAVWGAGQTLASLRRYRRARHQGMRASHSERMRFAGWFALTLVLALGGAASLVGIALSFSRGAWLGIAAALVAMGIVAAHKVPVVPIGAVTLVALFLLAGGMRYAPPALYDRYDQLISQLRLFNSTQVQITNANFAAVQRMAMWQAGIAMFEASPIIGIGIGNYNARYPDFYVNPAFPISAGHAHNYYIQAAAETGIIGLLTYLALIGTALFTSVRTARSADDNLRRAIGIGAVGVTVAVMVHNVVEDLHVLNLGVQLAAVWALAVIAQGSLRRATPLPVLEEVATQA